MPRYARFIAIAICTIALLAGEVEAQDILQPGQTYSGPLLNIKSPQTAGWQLYQSSPAGMVFAKLGGSHGESYIANVASFALKKTGNSDQFLALIKQKIEQDAAPERFIPLDSKYQYNDERGYPCVKFIAVTIDKGAAIRPPHADPTLEMIGLYCKHPQEEDLGFAAVFSHRGEEKDPNFAAEADSFIAGVQVPAQDIPAPPTQQAVPDTP